MPGAIFPTLKVFEKGLRKRSRCDREVSERDFVVSVGGVHEVILLGPISPKPRAQAC